MISVQYNGILLLPCMMKVFWPVLQSQRCRRTLGTESAHTLDTSIIRIAISHCTLWSFVSAVNKYSLSKHISALFCHNSDSEKSPTMLEIAIVLSTG